MSELKPANRFQEAFGLPVPGARTKARDHMEERIMDFIRSSPFAVLATSDQEGHCDASPRGGTPGFVRVIDKRRLLLPDVAGNRLFQSYGNVDGNGHVGLLFFIPGPVRITPYASTDALVPLIRQKSNPCKPNDRATGTTRIPSWCRDC